MMIEVVKKESSAIRSTDVCDRTLKTGSAKKRFRHRTATKEQTNGYREIAQQGN